MARRKEMRYIQYYSGTAAPKLLPQPPKSKTCLPKPVKQQSYTIHVDPLAVGGILVSAIMLILMILGFAQLGEARQELAQVTTYVNTLQAENKRLEDDYRAGYDLETIESAALGLGMIPMEEARHMTISLGEPETEDVSAWIRFTGFLTGLFA